MNERARRTIKLRERFARGGIVLDGAMGTELERLGADCSAPLWSARALVECPSTIEQLHRGYVEAGADVLIANTFRSNPRALRKAGLGADGAQLNVVAIELARRAAARASHPVLVAASVAPVEPCFRPDLVPDANVLQHEQEEMMDWLIAAEPDLIWFETMGTIREALSGARIACKRDWPFAICFTLSQPGVLHSGESLIDAVREIDALGPVAVGVNCVLPSVASESLRMLRTSTQSPIAIYAHLSAVESKPSGPPENPSSDEYAQSAMRWFELGASIVGGCCGTNADYIRAIVTKRDQRL